MDILLLTSRRYHCAVSAGPQSHHVLCTRHSHSCLSAQMTRERPPTPHLARYSATHLSNCQQPVGVCGANDITDSVLSSVCVGLRTTLRTSGGVVVSDVNKEWIHMDRNKSRTTSKRTTVDVTGAQDRVVGLDNEHVYRHNKQTLKDEKTKSKKEHNNKIIK